MFICPFSQLKGSVIADGEGLPQYKSIPEKCKSTDTKRAAFHKREAAFFRFFTESWGKSSLGARLRTRKVRGRDASLPAPLLAASLGLVGRGTVGALPQTPQGTLSLDPFSRLSWSRFHAPSACSFLVLCLSSCLLPQTFREEPFFISPSRNARTAVQPLPPHSCASRSADTQ